MIFLGIGLQYVTTLLTDLIGRLRPEWITKYNATIETQGYSDLSVMLIVITMLLIFIYTRFAKIEDMEVV